MVYKPKPIDTSQITLPEELRNLTDLLAKNTHDIWARQRQDEPSQPYRWQGGD